jgi:hypothetical protein
MERVSKKYKYLQMDSWFNEEQKEKLMKWALTAITFMDTENWKQFFSDVGYTGDYYWTITT